MPDFKIDFTLNREKLKGITTLDSLRKKRKKLGFPGGSDDKEITCNAGDLGLIPGWGRSPGEEHGNSLQYFLPGDSMDRGAWRAAHHGVTKSQTQLSD